MTGVGDGAAVVELATKQDFDVILMDFQMPLLDGLSATRAIRAHEAAGSRRRVPVIAMTASVLAEHRSASVDAGMDGFASKPVDWFALSHEIARVLGIAQQCADGAAAAFCSSVGSALVACSSRPRASDSCSRPTLAATPRTLWASMRSSWCAPPAACRRSVLSSSAYWRLK